MSKAKTGFIILVAVLVALVASLVIRPRPRATPPAPLVMFCAAAMKVPVTAIAAAYETECGREVQLQFGGSGTLLSSLQIVAGDLYLAADDSYLQLATEKGLVSEIFPVAFLVAGIVVAKDNPLGIASLQDLAQDNLRIGFAVPEAASIGRFSKQILQENGLWQTLSDRATLMSGTVTELANAVKLGALDAAIVWDAVAAQYPDLTFVNVPEFDAEVKRITLGVLAASPQPTPAREFARYLTASDRGLKLFREHRFTPVEGERWNR